MDVLERFLRYVVIDTPSDEETGCTPSTKCQFNLAHVLVEEMKAIGIADAHVDEKCYVYGTIPATKGLEEVPAIGFIAHIDTVSDFADHSVCPMVHENYDGGDIVLGDSGRILSPKEFPHLKKLVGRTIITSDGTTILGADDKAGVAEIMAAMAKLVKEERPHGKICIGFTPDEEIGSGAEFLDIAKFGAQFAYTIDGDEEGGIEYENFNAASAKIEVRGVNVHPGSSKNVMVNAALVAMEFAAMLPEAETPRNTEGYEGFYHLIDMKGEVGEAVLRYIVRDHDAGKLEDKLKNLKRIEEALNEKYGEGTVALTTKHEYRNMREMVEPHMHLITNAEKAARASGIEPFTVPIRGGTDGAALSFRGLPCPNLGTGGYGAHGPYEHVTLEGMEKMVEMILEIVQAYKEA